MNYSKDPSVKKLVAQAVKEDIGTGDITTRYVFPKANRINAVIVAREKGVVCGIEIAKMVFRAVDKNIKFSSSLRDAATVLRGMRVARLSGPAAGILSAERLALNFLGLLSGIATRTRVFAKKVKPHKIKILDTRKTVPGLRLLEKYAVKTGGGCNHRLRLDDMVLIKENHIDVAGWDRVINAVKAVKKNIPRIKIEIEARNLREFDAAIKAKPDIIMLDNMKINDIKETVRRRDKFSPKTRLEASGNIDIVNIARYAVTGVDFISLGTLTKDIDSLDFSLEVI
ncbi:MAG: carboxylating nicotinate-nucleotide diphosphorylase [Deltaproteobacteria bacterium]